MSKTLAESAAEILRASMGAPKDPMPSMGANAEDLGGSSNENPAGDAVGTKAAAKVKVAPKPGQSGAPAEPIKKGAPPAEQVVDEKGLVREEDEVELTEEELDAYLETLSEEELEALANQIDEDDEEFEQIDETYPPIPMHNVKDMNGKIVGTHSADRGFLPSPRGVDFGLKPHPTTIPNNHRIDKSTNLRAPPKMQEDLEQIDEISPELLGRAIQAAGARAKLVPGAHGIGHRQQVARLTDAQTLRTRRGVAKTALKTYSPVGQRKMRTNQDEFNKEYTGPGFTGESALSVDKMGSMKEDVDALFNGESLSEEFRDKATTIFEAAVKSRVEVVLEQVIAKNEEYLSEATNGIEAELTEKVDEYLNYVVEQWMQENALAVNSGLRAELAEDFINGLKNLFNEHYIDIPEDKVNVVDELADKVLGLESALEEACSNAEALIAELNEANKNNSINDFCEGLTQVQREKMRSLAEGVEFTSEGDFVKKLAMIRESYFPTKSNVKIAEKKVLSETSEESSEVETGTVMDHYVKAISKTVSKTGE
jgi:hypothetical protein